MISVNFASDLSQQLLLQLSQATTRLCCYFLHLFNLIYPWGWLSRTSICVCFHYFNYTINLFLHTLHEIPNHALMITKLPASDGYVSHCVTECLHSALCSHG